jgi:15-cis-phytoene synthase
MKRRDTSFYYSFVVLPDAQRRAIVAVWDFCRAVDDTVDEKAGAPGDPRRRAEATAELVRWRQELDACFAGRECATEQGRNLIVHVAKFGLPRQSFEDVIDGVEMDLDGRRYATFDDLRGYCLRVASAVGLICLDIFGARDEGSRQYAIDLGVALQLTNILRDLGHDLAGGRLYLPLDDLARFGVSEDDLRAGVMTAPIRALCDFEARRARDFFAKAAAELPRTDARRLVAARIMGAIYFDLLERIERSDYRVFNEKIRSPRWRKLVIAGRTWCAAKAGL